MKKKVNVEGLAQKVWNVLPMYVRMRVKAAIQCPLNAHETSIQSWPEQGATPSVIPTHVPDLIGDLIGNPVSLPFARVAALSYDACARKVHGIG